MSNQFKRNRPVREALNDAFSTLGSTAKTIRRAVNILDINLQGVEVEELSNLQQTKIETIIDTYEYQLEVANKFGLKLDYKIEDRIRAVLNS
jgi:ribosomal protein L20A (L18A)